MKKSKKACDTSSCFLCRLCMKEWLPAVAAHKKNMVYEKGDVIFKEGEEVAGIYFIYEGKVKVHKHWGEGKELIVRFAKTGGIFGHRGLGADATYPVSATALETTTVCFIEKEFFIASLKVNHDLLFELMLFYASELQESEKNMRNLAHMSVKGRIANALISLRDKFGYNKDGFLDIALSRQDLAAFTGTTYETAFRMMSELIEENAVALSGKNIAITNADKLLAIIAKETA